ERDRQEIERHQKFLQEWGSRLASPTGSGGGSSSTSTRWEEDPEQIHIEEGWGWGSLLSAGAGVMVSHYDEQLGAAARQSQVTAAGAPQAQPPPAAAPALVTPPGGAHTATGAATAGQAGQPAVVHHEMAAPGSRPRERSVDGTDPTDIVAHLD